MAAGGSVNVQLPASVAGAQAVALNVTATNTTGSGFLTVYPTGGSLPLASSVNYAPGANVPNFVIVPVGTGNQVTIYNGPPNGTGGSADVVVDLLGSFATVANTNGGAGHFNPLTPARITDTRTGSGQANAGKTIAANSSLTVQVTGQGGVPATGVSAVEVNVTEAANTAGGFLTVYPQGNTAPTASNLNFVAGQIIANRVIVPVNPANGQINILNHAGNTDVVVDVDGYFTDSTGASGAGSLFNSVTPSRVIDTRSTSPIGPGGNLNVPIAGHNGVPATGTANPPSAAVLNVTEADNTAGGFLTVSPQAPAPLASDVNFVPGVIVANGDIAALASDGSLNVFNHAGNTDVVLDVAGYFTPATPINTNQSITVTPASQTTKNIVAGQALTTASTSNTYTASGLPAGTYSIHLFPCTALGAPTSSGGATTFTPPAGPAAGTAQGDGATDNNLIKITSVNGTPIVGAAKVDSISPTGGTITFTVNTTGADCATPVVFQDAATNPGNNFLVDSSGNPTEPFGVAGQSNYIPAEAAPGTFAAPGAPALITTVNKSAMYIVAGGNTYYYQSTDNYQIQTPASSGVCTPTTQANFLNALTAGDGLNGTYAKPVGGQSTFCLNATSPAAPGGATATPQGTGGVKVGFTDSATADVVSYNIYRTAGQATIAPVCPAFAAGPSNPFTKIANVADSDPTLASGAAYSYLDASTTPGVFYCYAVTSVSSSAVEGPAVQAPASGANPVQAIPTPAASTPVSTATAESLPGSNVTTLVSGDALQVTFNQAVSLAGTFSLVVTDGANTATINNGDATAALSNSNTTVTYTLTATPFSTPGPVNTAKLEVASQSGVSNATGAWNLPGSAVDAVATNPATQAAASAAVIRVFGGNNPGTALGNGPTIGANTDGPGATVALTCTPGATVNVYDANGSTIGTGTCTGAGTVTVTTTTVTAAEILGATQQPAGGFVSFTSQKTAT